MPPSSLQESIATKLNSGLVRLASVRNYPKLQRRRVVGKFLKGRVFRVGALHRKPLTEQVLLRNRRGYVNAQLNTVAHAPSLYHWLFHRCGIPFEETQALIQKEGLLVNDTVIRDTADAEVQLGWEEWQKMNILVRTENPRVSENNTSDNGAPITNIQSSSTEQRHPLTNGALVPALQRALHRRYFFQYVHPGISISSDVADPKSFVHRLSQLMSPSEALGLNLLRPVGFMNGMRGLGIATNDVALLRYWNNECLGNHGVYDVRFRKGTPQNVVEEAHRHLQVALETVKTSLPSLMVTGNKNGKGQQSSTRVPCGCQIDQVPALSRDTVRSNLKLPESVKSQFSSSSPWSSSASLSDDYRLLVSTPLMPYREARELRRLGGCITLVRSGPFMLPLDLARIGQRELNSEELLLLFAFERKLKVNRMILSLTEFNDEAD